MPSFYAIPTLAGQAAIAEAVTNNTAINLTAMVVGDGNGLATTPLETQTSLVNLRATVALQSVTRDGGQVTAQAILDETTGGWTIREVGILDGDGLLFAVASVPATYKGTDSEGVFDELTIGLVLVISDTAEVTVLGNGLSYATITYVNETVEAHRTNLGTPIRPYWISVDSLTTTAPPVSPSVGATFVIPAAGASGVWAGHAKKLTQYLGSAGWIYVDPTSEHRVACGNAEYRFDGTNWVPVMATLNEHLAGTSTTLETNPAGVKAMIDQALANLPDAIHSEMFFLGMFSG
jgi:hypothetical protein